MEDTDEIFWVNGGKIYELYWAREEGALKTIRAEDVQWKNNSIFKLHNQIFTKEVTDPSYPFEKWKITSIVF